jgi:filamentous hemagglutinin family protein
MASTALAENTSAALPTGGEITSGQGSINTAPNLLTITQNSHVLDTNWSSFNIGSGATVSVLQPSVSSTLIGRIIGGGRSNIDGTLNANGRVVLVNSNGIFWVTVARQCWGAGGLIPQPEQL